MLKAAQDKTRQGVATTLDLSHVAQNTAYGIESFWAYFRPLSATGANTAISTKSSMPKQIPIGWYYAGVPPPPSLGAVRAVSLEIQKLAPHVPPSCLLHPPPKKNVEPICYSSSVTPLGTYPHRVQAGCLGAGTQQGSYLRLSGADHGAHGRSLRRCPEPFVAVHGRQPPDLREGTRGSPHPRIPWTHAPLQVFGQDIQYNFYHRWFDALFIFSALFSCIGLTLLERTKTEFNDDEKAAF